MIIRKARIEDEAQVIALMQELLIAGGEVGKEWRDEARIFRRVVKNPELGAILVAEEDGQIAGVTTLSYPVAIRCNGVYACIEENIVAKAFRGKGVGGKLLEAVIAEATAHGCDEIQVNAPSEMGYPLYMRHGFEDNGKKHIKAKLPLHRKL
ncbi:MAG: GNAT family N-acetyltransferase [Candidatus Abyssubacteria bacterium]